MSLRRKLSKLGALIRRRKPVDDLEEEIRAHLEMEERENLEAGMSGEEAYYAALRRFGNVPLTQERSREMWNWNSLETLGQDVRYGLRMLLKSPAFTIVAVITLALGIGANSAIFNVLDAVLLRTLPVKAPEQLVVLTDPDAHGRDYGQEGGDRSLLTFTEFQYLHDHNDVFSGVFATDSEAPKLQVSIGTSSSGAAEVPEEARVQLVSGNYFSVLGVRAATGRTFTPEVDRARGAAPVAVISYPFWKERFGLDPSALAQTIRIHQTVFDIIGVAAPGFFGTTVGEAPDVWIPMMMQNAVYPGRDLLAPAGPFDNQYIWLQAMARLKPNVTLQQSKAAINAVFKGLLLNTLGSLGDEKQRRGYLDQQLNVHHGSRGASTLHETFGNPLKVLMGIVGLVLLIACANVANLLLARGAARQNEFAVRQAVGAGRSRLVRQLLLESLLLAILGAAMGAVLAQWLDGLLMRVVVGNSLGPDAFRLSLRVDTRALGFTALVALLTTLLFGVIPALRSTSLEVSPVLKSAADARTGGASHQFLSTGRILVIAQVAISMVLLVAAGLFVHSLERLSEVSLGYNRDRLLLLRLDAAPAGYKGPAIIQLQQTLLAKFAVIPGVRSATLSSNGLFEGSDSGDPIAVEGFTPKSEEELHSSMDHVGPGYFSTVGIPLLRGREIGPQDTVAGLRAADINMAFARKYFPNTNPIGKHVRDTFPGNPGDTEIVGIVADARFHSLREEVDPRLFISIFTPLWEHAAVFFEIRTTADAESLSKALRKIVQETNSSFPQIEIQTMSGLVDRSMGTDRLITTLAGCFGALALLLASIGLYGVMSYAVARRTNEIGIRMALGARRGNVLRLVLGNGSKLALAGVAVGIVAALGLTRFLSSLLFDVKPTDPLTFIAVAVLLGGVALLASYIPARRATKVDPMVALRYE
jgi:predicted permease